MTQWGKEKLSDLFTDLVWGSKNIEFGNVYHNYPSTVLDEKSTAENEHLVLWKKYPSEQIHLLHVSKVEHANIIL